MHLFDLDLHPEGGLQFLGIDGIVKLNIDTLGYDGYLLEIVEYLERLKKKDEDMYIGMYDFALLDTEQRRKNKEEEFIDTISMGGGWQEYDGQVEYQIHISYNGCCIWLDFANDEELQFFIDYIRQWHEGLEQAKEISEME